jgi:hypothetical protein
MVLSIAVSGCEDDKNTSCAEAVDTMYSSDCKLWCECDSNGCDPYSCAWYGDDDPTYFIKSEAESVCDDMKYRADNNDCNGELQDLLHCFIEKRADDCGEDCEDPAEDYWKCVNNFLFF